MSIFTTSGSAVASSSVSKTTPTIQNISLTLAGTEYSVAIPSNSIAFALRVRGNSKLQFAYTSGESSTKFVTLFPGDTYSEEDISSAASITVYVQSSKPSEVLEVWSWT